LTLFAISLLGCGRDGGGASEVSTNAPPAKQSEPDIRVAEVSQPQGAAQSEGPGVIADGTYEVCDLHDEKGSDKPAGTHITLGPNDEIVIDKGRQSDPLSTVVFRHFAKPEADREKRAKLKPQKETSVTVIKCCEGERLGATMAFEHNKNGKPVEALHALIIENAGKYESAMCTRKPIIVIDFCYPTLDDNGTGGWSCSDLDGDPHKGDVHAQLSIRLPGPG
jgi:hypothetical protein